jgi:hypothetical protein
LALLASEQGTSVYTVFGIGVTQRFFTKAKQQARPRPDALPIPKKQKNP